LALALVVYPRPNLLLLDEPTNHLDLDMRQALEIALNDYEGAVVLVTHDRHLVASVCDRLWRVADGGVQAFDGDLDDYARWLADRGRKRGSPAASAPVPKRAAAVPEPARPVALSREELKRLRDLVRKSETRQARIEELLRRVDQKLADPALYENGGALEAARLMKEQSDLREELAGVEETWLDASAQLEALDDG
ncbi:MAG: ABC transporter ATP-binding protein, partial [Panacagrimonas sp.]